MRINVNPIQSLKSGGSLVTYGLFLALGFALPGQEWAWAGRLDIVPGSRYTSGRGAAMGDAVLPLGDDGASGLFYNPAILGHLKGFQVEPLNVQGYVGQALAGTLGYTSYEALNLQTHAPELKKNSDETHGMGFSLFPNVQMKGLAFGVLVSEQTAAKYLSASDEITYKSNYQFIPTVGTGVRLAGGIVRLGYSLQYVNKTEGRNTVPYASAKGYNVGLKQGSALSHNVGAALNFPTMYLPSFNFVFRNIGGAKYSSTTLVPMGNGSVGAPDAEKTTIDGSVSYEIKMGNGAITRFVYEMRDATNRSGTGLMLRTAVGMEWTFRGLFFFRAGIGSGYPNAGIGLKQKAGEFSISWTSEEVGIGLRNDRDTRYMLSYQAGIF